MGTQKGTVYRVSVVPTLIRDGPKRRSMFPSWTRAGWTGATRWMCDTRFDAEPMLSLPRSAHLLNEAGEVQQRPSLAKLQDVLDSTTILVLEALILPASSIGLKDTESDDGVAITIAERPLGITRSSPVFATDHVSRRADNGRFVCERDLVANVRAGLWSCIYLAEQLVSRVDRVRRFVLVVEWKDECTATRVDGITLRMSLREDAKLAPFETLLETRKFKLI